MPSSGQLVVAACAALARFAPCEAADNGEPRQPGESPYEDYVLMPGSEANGGHIARGEPKPGHSYFFSIGDWGTVWCERAFAAGEHETQGGAGDKGCIGKTEMQKVVARSMAKLAVGLKPSSIVSLGDNFYFCGVRDLDDPQFKHSFEDVYDLDGLRGVPWKVVLGDHDHRGNITAQIEYSERNPAWEFPHIFWSFEVPVPGGGDRKIEVVFVDSMCLEGAMDPELVRNRRFNDDYDPMYAGAEVGAGHWKWLEEKLGKRAPLRVVIGHRPLVSAGVRGRQPSESAVADRLHVMLLDSAKHTPTMYYHGHDHLMQVWKDGSSGLIHAGNGAGAMPLHPLIQNVQEEQRNMHLQWASNSQHGFAVHELGSDFLTTYFVGAWDGTVLYSVRQPLGVA